MTGIAANPNTHLANMLNEHHQRLTAVEHQQQAFILNTQGKSVMIQGNLLNDNKGEATGLGLVFGLALLAVSPVTTTITTTLNSVTATVGSLSGLVVGEALISANVLPGTTIEGINIAATSITMTSAAKASAGPTALTTTGWVNVAATLAALSVLAPVP